MREPRDELEDHLDDLQAMIKKIAKDYPSDCWEIAEHPDMVTIFCNTRGQTKGFTARAANDHDYTDRLEEAEYLRRAGRATPDLDSVIRRIAKNWDDVKSTMEEMEENVEQLEEKVENAKDSLSDSIESRNDLRTEVKLRDTRIDQLEREVEDLKNR